MAGKAGAKNAKIASKNDPTQRGSQKKKYFKGKEVVPVQFIGFFVGLGSYMAMDEASNESIILGENGSPLPWSNASNEM